MHASHAPSRRPLHKRLSRALRIVGDESEPRSERAAAARRAASVAEKLGILVRPTRCERCGERSRALERHHEDHNRPLDVAFVCPLCHQIADAAKMAGRSAAG